MNKRLLVVVLGAGLAVGCGKKADGDAGGAKAGGSCKEAVATSMKMVSQMLRDDIRPEKVADAIKLVGDAQLAACVDDKWPAAAVACLSAAKTTAALLACEPVMDEVSKSLTGIMVKIGPQLFAMMKPEKDFRDGKRAPDGTLIHDTAPPADDPPPAAPAAPSAPVTP